MPGSCGHDREGGLGVGLGHDDLDRRRGPGREVLADRPLGDDRVGVVEEGLVDGGAARLEGRGERRGREQDDQRDHPGAARVPPDEVGDPAPDALGADDVLGVHVVELGRERPERLAAEEQQDRRQEGQRREQRPGDAERADRAEARGAAQLGEQQAEQAEDDGRGRRDDRLDGAAPRPLQRHPRVRLVVQLLLEPADEQQGVVGRGTHDEDEQDALRLPRQRDHVVEGQLVDHQRGGAQAEHGAEQHGERQDRAAVDDEQDDEHDEQGDAEQDAVDAGERGREVGDQPAGPADVAVEAGRHQGALDLGAHRLGALDERRGLAAGLGARLGVERHRDQHGLAVLGRDRDDRRARDQVVAERRALTHLGEGETRHRGRERHPPPGGPGASGRRRRRARRPRGRAACRCR